MTRTEAMQRGNAAIWDFRESSTLEDRMRAAYDLDEVSPIIMDGMRIVQWPEDRGLRRRALRSAAAICGELAALAAWLGGIACVAIMFGG